jgi:hypothetical protein
LAKLAISEDGTKVAMAKIDALRLEPQERKALLYELGAKQIENIKNGLEGQVDIHGVSFTPSRRAIRDKGMTLIDTGAMEGGVGITKIDDKSVTIGETAPREAMKAFRHQFGIGVKKREWFGFRAGDVDRLQDVLNNFFFNRKRK